VTRCMCAISGEPSELVCRIRSTLRYVLPGGARAAGLRRRRAGAADRVVWARHAVTVGVAIGALQLRAAAGAACSVMEQA